MSSGTEDESHFRATRPEMYFTEKFGVMFFISASIHTHPGTHLGLLPSNAHPPSKQLHSGWRRGRKAVDLRVIMVPMQAF